MHLLPIRPTQKLILKLLNDKLGYRNMLAKIQFKGICFFLFKYGKNQVIIFEKTNTKYISIYIYMISMTIRLGTATPEQGVPYKIL